MLTTVGIAIYGLILFLDNFNSDIKHYKPFWKFFSIKLTLFLSMWQKVLIEQIDFKKFFPLNTMQHGQLVTLDSGPYINNMLIIIEMLGLSIILTRCYNYQEFKAEIDQEQKDNSILTIPKILYRDCRP